MLKKKAMPEHFTKYIKDNVTCKLIPRCPTKLYYKTLLLA